MNNFFKTENILQLRELALKEVAFRVEKKVENEIVSIDKGVRHEKFLACISSNEKTPRHIIRNHFKLVTELGGEVLQVASANVLDEIIKTCQEKQITTICMGQPAFKMPSTLFSISKYKKFLASLAQMNIDLIILA